MYSIMRNFQLVLLLCVLTSSARARLGETVEQCTERYGPLIEKRQPLLPQSDSETAVYSKSGVTIIVEFHKGTAWHITFRKPGLQNEEVEALLKANATKGNWSTPLLYGERDYRLSGDRNRIAVFSSAEKNMTQLEIMLREYSDQRRANYVSSLQKPAPKEGSKPVANPLPGF
jgi:hypothetical protein